MPTSRVVAAERGDAARPQPSRGGRKHGGDRIRRAREGQPPRHSRHRVERQILRFGRSGNRFGRKRFRRLASCAEIDHELGDRHSRRDETEDNARLGSRRRHGDRLVDRHEMLELSFQDTQGRQRRVSAGQRVEPPEQQVDAMRDRRASLRSAGEDGVEMHRIAVAGNGGEPRLIGRGEGSFR
jgi:hypothetical protein